MHLATVQYDSAGLRTTLCTSDPRTKVFRAVVGGGVIQMTAPVFGWQSFY